MLQARPGNSTLHSQHPLHRADDALLAAADSLLRNRSELKRASPSLLDIQSIDPSIVVELRYAGRNNLTGHALYPPGTRALVRPEVAQRLAIAQRFLRQHGHGLKIWDAYRPRSVQVQLWRAAPGK